MVPWNSMERDRFHASINGRPRTLRRQNHIRGGRRLLLLMQTRSHRSTPKTTTPSGCSSVERDQTRLHPTRGSLERERKRESRVEDSAPNLRQLQRSLPVRMPTPLNTTSSVDKEQSSNP